MKVCKRAIYSGRVQGVGFRYTTQRIADGFPVSGFVKNLPDGSVEVMAEGEPESVSAFLNQLSATMASYIAETNVSDDSIHDFTGFQIRF